MAAVDQGIGSKALTEQTVLVVLNRELVPLVRRLRAVVNERLDASVATIGDGVSLSYAIEHGLGTRDVFVTVYDLVSYLDVVPASVTRTDEDTVTVTFAAPPAVDFYRVLIRT